jgi:hypothetical protein
MDQEMGRTSLIDADAASDMLARENSGFSVDASVRITLFRLQLRVYCQPLEHLLRYCARPPFALERLSVIYGEDGRQEPAHFEPEITNAGSSTRREACR